MRGSSEVSPAISLSDYDVLVIKSLDRLARSTKDLLDIYDDCDAAGVALGSCASGSTRPRLSGGCCARSWERSLSSSAS
jgi:DNA invertase Pin-like site-specific DNA recombinase